MADYLMRHDAPLTEDQWEALDHAVTEAARRVLVGRRFLELVGPLGAGVQTVPFDRFGPPSRAQIDFTGEAGEPVQVQARVHLPLPMIYQDFQLLWRDVETSQTLGIPLDLGPAVAAAEACALAEDDLIFHGKGAEYPGLLTVEGRQRVKRGDWAKEGQGFEDVVKGVEALAAAGHPGPYALVLSPQLYAALNRVYKDTGVLEIDQVRQVASAGVFVTPVLAAGEAVLVSVGAANFDLVVAQDLITAFLETTRMNHLFRVFEILALRIKRPGAICTLEG